MRRARFQGSSGTADLVLAKSWGTKQLLTPRGTPWFYSSTFRFLTGAITFLLVLGLAAAVVWTLNTQPTTIILPTPIPSRTPTATPVPTVALGNELLVSAGGFSLRPPSGYRAAVQNNTASLTNEAGDALFVLRGEWLADGESLTESLQAAVAGLTPTMVIDAAGIQPVSIDGGEAVGADLTGGEDGADACRARRAAGHCRRPVRARARLCACAPTGKLRLAVSLRPCWLRWLLRRCRRRPGFPPQPR